MCSLFKSKGPKITDTIFLNEQGCRSAIAQWLQQNTTGVVVVWFQHDLEQLRTSLGNLAEDRFILADRLAFSHGSERSILFVGHYPVRATEYELFENQGLKEATVYSHLDMPLLKTFGSERIKELMIKMGMKEDEPLSHAMITSAIGNAQDKIAKSVITDMRAPSEEEWMRMNVPQKELLYDISL
jgi:hypothetical protein